jgi:hypothetical protein
VSERWRAALCARADILAYANEVDLTTQLGESAQTMRMARIYLAAHLGTVSIRCGVPGPVVGESVGLVSRSYAVLASAGAYALAASIYGLQYLTLIDMSLAAMPIAI